MRSPDKNCVLNNTPAGKHRANHVPAGQGAGDRAPAGSNGQSPAGSCVLNQMPAGNDCLPAGKEVDQTPAGNSSGKTLTLDEARAWARVGVLAALALVFGYVETFIPLPVPVPGVKLGLGNIVVLLALELLDVKSAALVALVKVLAAGFLFGNPVMMLYSAGGTLLAFAAMAALSRVRGLSVVFAAIVGAVLHNMGQLVVASLILGTPLVWASAPVLVIAACATGALSGIATRYALGCLRVDFPVNRGETRSGVLSGGRHA